MFLFCTQENEISKRLTCLRLQVWKASKSRFDTKSALHKNSFSFTSECCFWFSILFWKYLIILYLQSSCLEYQSTKIYWIFNACIVFWLFFKGQIYLFISKISNYRFNVCDSPFILYYYIVPNHEDNLKGQKVMTITICSHSIYQAPVSSLIS